MHSPWGEFNVEQNEIYFIKFKDSKLLITFSKKILINKNSEKNFDK